MSGPIGGHEIPPERLLTRVRDAQERFAAAIEHLTDADVSRPSLLPAWTVGHVLAHVARNADSHVRRTEAAARGEVVDQYPGGMEGRAEEIEDGAHRGASVLRSDVAVSAEALDGAWRSTPTEVWRRTTRDVGGRERPLHRLPWRRWQELEVHVVDLDVGVTHRHWPLDFVAEWLPCCGPAQPNACLLKPSSPRLRSGMTTTSSPGGTDDSTARISRRWRPGPDRDRPAVSPR